METPFEKPPEGEKLLPQEAHAIEPKLQTSNFDCGQTCLDMLGYDGHNMFPKNEVSSSDLRSIPGAQEVTVLTGQEETLDYTYPHIWILLGKDKVAGAQHWAIRHGNKIYCPTVGTMDSDEYKKKYVAFVLQEFVIPLKGQKIPENYYKQHPSPMFEENTGTKPKTDRVLEKQENNITPIIEETYELFGRKVKYIAERTLPNGIKQFQVKYLDDPKIEFPKGKKGDREWYDDWQLRRLTRFKE